MATDAPTVVDRLRDYFSSGAGERLAAVYLYGSLARGGGRPDSDVDIGLLFGESPPASLSGPPMRIEDELESLLGRRVQVVDLGRAPADLIHRVLRDGELVFESDPSRRIRFEVASRREYFDLLPILRRYRRPRAAGR